MRILVVDTYYPEFLTRWYARTPEVTDLSFEQHRARLFQAGFGVSDAYPYYLNQLGWDAQGVVCNADALQARWALEQGLAVDGNIHDRRRQIVAAQVRELRPDVLYVFEWCPLGDAFLDEMRSYTRLVVGQIASPLPSNRTFRGYQLMISSWPPIVDYFRSVGCGGEGLKLGFDARVLDHLTACERDLSVTFVGGFADSHPDRVQWLEYLARSTDLSVFGYGVDRIPSDSPIRRLHQGEVWGWEMYRVLQRSKVTLNRHAMIDVRGSVATNLATNMRLYEATGVGAFLLTDHKDNMQEMFEPGQEVVTYVDSADCATKVDYYLSHAGAREQIARAGQQRALRDHGYHQRMAELIAVLQRHL